MHENKKTRTKNEIKKLIEEYWYESNQVFALPELVNHDDIKKKYVGTKQFTDTSLFIQPQGFELKSPEFN